MMDNENIGNDVKLVGQLLDAYGNCDEDSSEVIYQLAYTKLQTILKGGHPRAPYLQALMPILESDDKYDVSVSEHDAQFNALMKQSADAGVPQAQYEHACRLYEQGHHRAAVRLYKLSADNGFPPSQYCYGLDVYNGVGTDANEVEGLHFIELAAGRLYNLAIEFLIHLYRDDKSGEGSKKFDLYSRMLVWSEQYE